MFTTQQNSLLLVKYISLRSYDSMLDFDLQISFTQLFQYFSFMLFIGIDFGLINMYFLAL